MSAFVLHPQLAADSLPVADLALCSVRLVNDSHYPWLLLVPRRPDLVDLIDLDRDSRIVLMDEIALACEALKAHAACDKLNVASLGNQVPQLHVHVIARRRDDAAWPKPIWGVVAAAPYRQEEADRLTTRFHALFAGQADR